jgi:beta-lactamase superfamily II metal-dependent hydrolase
MLVKVNNIDIDKNRVRVSKLDIDDYGSIIVLKELELKIPANDNSIIQTLQNSSYAAIFTGDTDDNNSTIILANGITIYELNK